MKSRVALVFFCVMFTAFALSSDPGAFAQQKPGGSSSSSRPSSTKPATKPASPGIPSKPSSGYGNTATKPGTPPAGATNSTKPGTKQSNPAGGYGNTATKGAAQSKTPAADTTQAKPQPSTGGYGNTATGSAAPAAPGAQAPKTQVQQKMERSVSKKESARALDSYKKDQAKFKSDPGAKAYTATAPVERTTVDSIRSRVTYTSGSTYYTRRNVFYTSYGWSAPPYIYGSYHSFGIWDAMMLWFMLDHIRDDRYATMYYHHRDDPGMQQFRKEVDRLSVENAELKDKLKEMDQRTKALEAQGVKPDPTYVPDEAASIVLASAVVDKELQPSSSGFPWFWTITTIAVVIAIVLLMKRRRI